MLIESELQDLQINELAQSSAGSEEELKRDVQSRLVEMDRRRQAAQSVSREARISMPLAVPGQNFVVLNVAGPKHCPISTSVAIRIIGCFATQKQADKYVKKLPRDAAVYIQSIPSPLPLFDSAKSMLSAHAADFCHEAETEAKKASDAAGLKFAERIQASKAGAADPAAADLEADPGAADPGAADPAESSEEELDVDAAKQVDPIPQHLELRRQKLAVVGILKGDVCIARIFGTFDTLADATEYVKGGCGPRFPLYDIFTVDTCEWLFLKDAYHDDVSRCWRDSEQNTIMQAPKLQQQKVEQAKLTEE